MIPIKDIDVGGKAVLVLVDFIAPLERAVPTLEYLSDKGARIIVASNHEKHSLVKSAEKLAVLLGRKFVVVPESAQSLPEYDIPHLHFISHDPSLLKDLHSGDVAVLENQDSLSGLADVFINDAFGYALVGLEHDAVGFSYEKTAKGLEMFATKGKRPFVAVLGGVQISGKEKSLDHLMKRADKILLGGGVANLFLMLAGFEIGKSVYDHKADQKAIKSWLRDHRHKLILPVDVVVSASLDGAPECVKVEKVKSHQMILDIGPKTILTFSHEIKKAGSLVWRETLGYVENRQYAHGTLALFRLFAGRAGKSDIPAVAGGDKVFALASSLGLDHKVHNIISKSSALLNFLAEW